MCLCFSFLLTGLTSDALDPELVFWEKNRSNMVPFQVRWHSASILFKKDPIGFLHVRIASVTAFWHVPAATGQTASTLSQGGLSHYHRRLDSCSLSNGNFVAFPTSSAAVP